jgi:predicted AAA+ superfamily ATPase
MTDFYPRHLALRMQEALADTPVVLINGPRQCGKSTMAQHYLPDTAYFTLDDDAILAAAKADPGGFVRRLDRAVIDEIQRAPELLRAIKLSVDQDRRPGRFVLTGSANILALSQISDSLAGRMEILTLLPLSQAEIAHRPSTFLTQAASQQWAAAPPNPLRGDALIERVLAGGYPEMLGRTSAARRTSWASAYLKTLLERDLRDVAEIEKLDAMPRLLEVLAQLSGQLVNSTQIGGQLGLDVKTTQKYIGLLEHIFLVKRLPPWGRNALGRLIKTPKLHFCDAGLQASLTRLTLERAVFDKTRFGATLETWVFAELLKALSLSDQRWRIYHYRDKDQAEVDFVLENPLQEVMGIEVKASSAVKLTDFKGIIRLRDLVGEQFLCGVVVYDGEHVLPFGPNLWAVPLAYL